MININTSMIKDTKVFLVETLKGRNTTLFLLGECMKMGQTFGSNVAMKFQNFLVYQLEPLKIHISIMNFDLE